MKKFLTIIAFTSAFIPAIHGMEVKLPADVQNESEQKQNELMQEQYKLIGENLKLMIQDADEQLFKKFLDPWTLPIECLTELEHVVFEAKNKISAELNAKDCKNKNWSKMIKGSLAGIMGISGAVLANSILLEQCGVRVKVMIISIPAAFIGILPTYLSKKIFTLLPMAMQPTSENHNNGVHFLTGVLMAYKVIPYGYKNIKNGLNYKQYLQDQLANLDAIAAHISQAKAQATQA